MVFLGWPGQNEPEDQAAASWLDSASSAGGEGSVAGGAAPPAHTAYSTASLPDLRGGGVAAQPPRMLQERLAAAHATGARQLGYVVVTRPLRQGRLRLALEEVLCMQLDPPPPAQALGAFGRAGSADAGAAGDAGTAAPGGTAAAAAGAAAGAPPADVSPAALLGLAGSDGTSEGDGASSLGSRASSSSNLRCAGATLVRATPSSSCIADAAAVGAPLRLLLAEDNAINMKVRARRPLFSPVFRCTWGF